MAKPTITQTKISQEINLEEELGVDLSQFPSLKQSLGQAMIDKIVERTESGKGVKFDTAGRGRQIDLRKPYSKEYQDSLEFKAAGKSKNDINMTLSGDMLRSIDLVRAQGNTLEIAIDDPDEAAKAHGHQTGKNGQVKKMLRPFFGVTKSEIKEVSSQFKSEINRAKEIEREETSLFNQGILDALRRLGGS